jgi:type II secretory pathway pseudopilin PulG
MNGQRGMTMVELLVGLAIVMFIIGAAATAYLKLLRTYRTQGRLAEGYMANLTGLELLRYDIEMAGFGLPAALAPGATYNEAAQANSPAPPYDPTLLNDSGTVPNGPRALAHLNNAGANGSDVLSIKSSAANPFNNPAGKKWSMILTTPTPKVKLWGVTALDPVMDFTTGDNFIILDNTGTLQPGEGQWSCYQFNSSAPNSGYYASATSIPYPNPQHIYYMFGLDSSAGGHRMPFNRVDYYLDKIAGSFPSTCAQSTFTLYRSLVDQATGQLDKTPLIDCVRDFQVAFGLDTSGGTLPIQWQDNLAGLSAAQIQQQLREVRVFVLYQEGLGDTSTTPAFRFSGILNLGDQDIAHGLDNTYSVPPNNFQQLSNAALSGHPALNSFSPAGADLQYRWKILEMDVKPMNLLNLTSTTPR